MSLVSKYCLLLIAYCLLLYCLLLIAYCLLLIALLLYCYILYFFLKSSTIITGTPSFIACSSLWV